VSVSEFVFIVNKNWGKSKHCMHCRANAPQSPVDWGWNVVTAL
jgi:hypothetical protein